MYPAPVVLLLGLLLLPAARAEDADSATTTPPAVRDTDLTVLLDPDAATEARLAELHNLTRNARAGHHASICTLGRLAVQGESHPAELPAFDYGDAGTWLNRCVLGGDLDAMLVMAELELAQHRALEAMIWAQAYLKLAAALDPDSLDAAAPYKAGLLARIERFYTGTRPSNEEVLEYVAGLLANHGERITTGFRNGGGATWLALPTAEIPEPVNRSNRALAGSFTRDSRAARDELVYAVFLIEVDPEGKPDRILVMEAWPDAGAARSLRSLPVSRRFEPSAASESRWTYLSAFLDNKAYRLRPDADPKHRPDTR